MPVLRKHIARGGAPPCHRARRVRGRPRGHLRAGHRRHQRQGPDPRYSQPSHEHLHQVAWDVPHRPWQVRPNSPRP